MLSNESSIPFYSTINVYNKVLRYFLFDLIYQKSVNIYGILKSTGVKGNIQFTYS